MSKIIRFTSWALALGINVSLFAQLREGEPGNWAATREMILQNDKVEFQQEVLIETSRIEIAKLERDKNFAIYEQLKNAGNGVAVLDLQLALSEAEQSKYLVLESEARLKEMQTQVKIAEMQGNASEGIVTDMKQLAMEYAGLWGHRKEAEVNAAAGMRARLVYARLMFERAQDLARRRAISHNEIINAKFHLEVAQNRLVLLEKQIQQDTDWIKHFEVLSERKRR